MHAAVASALSADPVGASASCIVCGGQSGHIVLRDNGYVGVLCSCGTIFASPRPLHSDSDDTDVLHLDVFYDLSAARKARWVRKHTMGTTLLEIGCGNGAFLEAAAREGFVVEGVEPVAPKAERASARLGRPVHQTWLHEFVTDERYDVVYHCDMLAHLSDPVDALRRMRAILAPRGVLAFEVGLIADVAVPWYRSLRGIGFPMHRWLYSDRSVRALLAKADLRVTTTKRYDQSASLLVTETIRLAHRAVSALGWRRRSRALTTPGALATDVGSGPSDGGADGWLEAQPFYANLQNALRYGVGSILPPLGPGTMLVVAEPQ
jgi:SAM-dependent methyltransferase